jgi:hypothetical protein
MMNEEKPDQPQGYDGQSLIELYGGFRRLGALLVWGALLLLLAVALVGALLEQRG